MRSGLLLSGKSMSTSNGIKVYPLTLGEIMEIGMTNYSYYISTLQMKEEMLKVLFKVESEEELETISEDRLKNLITLIMSNEQIGQDLLYFLSSLVRERVVIHEYNLYVIDEEEKNIRLIDKDVYNEIIDILELQNCSKTLEEKNQEDPADAKARELLEKRKKAREKLEKAKQANGEHEEAELDDLISSLSVANVGLNILNVWDLTLYQFYNQLRRYGAKANNDISIKSMLAGASDVELKNWMGKLNDN